MKAERVTRVFEERGATTVLLDAIQRADGGFTLSGYDLGDGPREAYGRDDLEYELTVGREAMPAAFVALLRAVLAGSGTPVTALRACLEADRVPHKFRIVP